MNDAIIERIKFIGDDLAISPKLIQAIVQVESGFDPWAYRYEPTWEIPSDRQTIAKIIWNAGQNKITESSERTLLKSSFGLMQVMGATARDLGFMGQLTSLLDIHTNLFWGATYLKKRLIKYPDLRMAIAAYNEGSIKDVKVFHERVYVDKVMEALRGLR